MDLAENRFGKTWKHFLEVLKVDYNCSLADVCRDQHTTLGGMSSWMSRRGAFPWTEPMSAKSRQSICAIWKAM